jgi:SpoVK/Ycf46/Vps4 family AAA+-type ATPase
LAVAVQTDELLLDVFDTLQAKSLAHVAHAIRTLLACSTQEAMQLCMANSRMARLHLISYNAEAYAFADRLRLPAGLADVLGGTKATLATIFAEIYALAPSPTLQRQDFAHMASEVELMIDYLRGAMASKVKGVNVLLAGLPGCGKTELARLAARELGCICAEVKATDREGEPATSKERIVSLILAQAFLAGSNRHLLVFDEVEDVFGTEDGFQTYRPFGKRWLNEVLETNTTPTIWIANSIDGVDAAHLRRFDIAIRFAPLPRQARERIIQRHLASIGLSEHQRHSLVEREWLLPSQVAMAAKVAANSGKDRDGADIAMRVIDGTMALLGQSAEPARHEEFDPALVNAEAELCEVCSQLRVAPTAKLLLLGPTGAGKTAFAYFLARELGLGSLAVSGAELVSDNFGMSLHRIGEATRQAKAEKKLLLIDEAEALLATVVEGNVARAGFISAAARLIGEHDGVVCMATSGEGRLAAPLMRQVDLKLRFKVSTAAQRQILFNRFCSDVALETDEHQLLDGMTTLVPGDFLLVRRRQRVSGKAWSVTEWLAALKAIEVNKSASPHGIGFIRHS